jgi:hypothetical protein
MLADNAYLSVSAGKIKGPEPDSSILAVVAFVEKHLISFSQKYTGSPIENEKGLTQKLVLLLNFHANSEGCLFWFDKEYMENPEQGTSPQVDIGTITKLEQGIVIESKSYSKEESFFSLEAKRLGGKLEKKRSKEYLIGRFEHKKYINSGGVERFKQGIHGKNLKYGAVIAYVQKHDFSHWHNRINSWIDDLIQKQLKSSVNWTLKDKLSMEYSKSLTAKFISVNSRQNDSVTLFHLWTKLFR